MASEPYTTVALVTGANQGIGFEIAKKLAIEHPDYHVYVAGRRQDAVNEAAETIRALGGHVEGLVLDITSDASIAEAAQTVKQKWGRLDIFVNNAGIGSAHQSNPRDEWRTIYDTNVVGTFQVTDAFIPLLEQSQVHKRIVMMSSSLGSAALKMKKDDWMHNLHGFTPYSTSKAALNRATLQYAVKYENDASWKINLCCPGYCATNMNDYAGTDTPQDGALNACRLATLGPDGESGTYSNRHGPIPW